MFEYFLYALLLLVVVIAVTAAGLVCVGALIVISLSWLITELTLGVANLFIWIYYKLRGDGTAKYLSVCRFLS